MEVRFEVGSRARIDHFFQRKYTKKVAHFVRYLRSKMSIKDTAEVTGLHWETVKNIEKDWLAKKYKHVPLKEVQYLSIDEVYLGKKFGYLTVVRDLISGSVLLVGKGKGADLCNQGTR